MTFARVSSTFGLLPFGATALVLALTTGCGDDDGFGPSPEPQGGEAGEPGTGGGASGGKGGSGGGASGTAGETPLPEGGAGGDGTEPTTPEVGWSKKFALPGVNGATTSVVNSVLTTGVRKLWVAGEFSLAGDVPAKNVAIWNGQRWSALGEGLEEVVEQLAEAPEENMYALVRADEGESPLRYWDGTTWSVVPIEFSNSQGFAAIRAMDVGPDGTLYVAGYFDQVGDLDAPGVAALAPGGEWEPLPLAPEILGDSAMDTVKVVGADVCVGGVISETGVGAACLEDGTWVSQTANLAYGQVYSFTVSDGALYAVGNFMLDGIETGGGLALWTGEEWELVGGGLLAGSEGVTFPPSVHAIAIDGDKVYVSGFFSFAGGAFVRHVAMWNGTKWNDMNGGLQKFMGVDFIEAARGRTLAVDDGGELYVGGRLTFAGAENALRVARWDGADWNSVDDPQAVRLGVNGFLDAVYEASDGSIYAGGGFQHLGGDALALGVARFVPGENRWYPLGAGLEAVRTLVEHDGVLFAGGDFISSGSAAGSASVKAVGRWDGAAWRSVGGGLNGGVNRLFSGKDGKLYVGGRFTTAGAVDVSNVAVWDGAAWSALGAIGEGESDEVRAFALDAEGELYAGGWFTTASGAPAANIVRWEDEAWVQVGDGVDDAVDSMVLYDGKVVIGGAFAHSGAVEVPHVAFWNAENDAWEPVGGGLASAQEFGVVRVQAMAVHGKDLYVAGIIDLAGAAKVSHIARFDGEKWHDVDRGLDDVVESLHVGKSALWVGGTFTRAGGYGSIGIARFGFAP